MIFLTIILGAIILGLLCLHWYQTNSRFAKLFNKFPMTPYKPLVGHVMDYSSDAEILFPQVRKLLTTFKETFGTWSVHIAALHIVTPDDAEIILTSMKHIQKGRVYEFIQPWLGEGLLISNSGKWQHRRKILTPTFHFNILRKFVDIFSDHCTELIIKIKDECQKTNELNLVPLITHKTLASICETAMGTKLNLKDKRHSTYLNAIYSITPIIIQRALTPPYYFHTIFNCSLLGLKQNKFVRTLHNFTTSVIKEREANFADSDVNLNNINDDNDGLKKKRLAMLDLLISAKRHRNEIDDEGIREEVDTFMFEGHDTTAIGICMCLMLLAYHEDIQKQIITELDEIFGDDKRPASYEDLQQMKYLELCIKESLRLYPSVPLISRKITEETPLTKNVIPADCEIFIHIYNIHRDPEIYPDPEKFDPERFRPENSKGRHPYSYIPFSAGPRNCIGQKYAILEMKSIISAIFRNFTLEPVSKFEELRWMVDLVLRVNGPINVKFNLRK